MRRSQLVTPGRTLEVPGSFWAWLAKLGFVIGTELALKMPSIHPFI